MRTSNPPLSSFRPCFASSFRLSSTGLRRRAGQNMGKKERQGDRKGRNGEGKNAVAKKQAAQAIKIYQSAIRGRPSSFLYFRRPDRTSFGRLLLYFFFPRPRNCAISLSFRGARNRRLVFATNETSRIENRLTKGPPDNYIRGNIFICISTYAIKGNGDNQAVKYIIDCAVSAISSSAYERIGAILAEWDSRCPLRVFLTR